MFMPHTRGTVFYAPYEGYYVYVLTPYEGLMFPIMFPMLCFSIRGEYLCLCHSLVWELSVRKLCELGYAVT